MRDIDVSFDAPPGVVTALLGPNGAGKSTVLRAIADAETRRVGLMFQDHLLFPHMTALDNVAFGARSRDVGRAWLERVGLSAFAGAKPRTLSGGQAQLVALARTLAADPEILLLDEPLAALDAGTRVAVRRDLHKFLSEFAGPTVLVTHDPVDAYVLADRVVVIEAGHITQQGTLDEITARPASRYVAEMVGTNLLRGVVEGLRLTIEGGLVTLTIAEEFDGAVLATIAPEAVTLHRDVTVGGSARNQWFTRVAHVDSLGPRARVQLDAPLPLVVEVTTAAVEELRLTRGVEVWASVKATEITTYPGL
ncbi:MAG: molybdate transport system ATP-binding protein [Actinomycetota bacterium]